MEELFSIQSFEFNEVYKHIQKRINTYLPYLSYIFPCLNRKKPDKSQHKNHYEKDMLITKTFRVSKLYYEIEDNHRHNQYLETFRRKMKVNLEVKEKHMKKHIEQEMFPCCEWETIL